MIIQKYKRYITEGKVLLIVSFLFAILVRIVFTLTSNANYLSVPHTESPINFLWDPLAQQLSTPLIFWVGAGGLILIFMVLEVSHINTKHVLIRRKSLLPAAFILLLFSCSTYLLSISAYLISALFILFMLSALFSAYNSDRKQLGSFNASVMLAFGSLFNLNLLMYLPLLWVGMLAMRCLNFRSLLATLFGVILVFFPVFSYFLYVDNLQAFYNPFISFLSIDFTNLPVYKYLLSDYIILGIIAFILTLIFISNYMDSYKDKIKIRAYNLLLTIFIVFSLVCSLTLNISPATNIFIALAAGALTLGHFFALVEEKWKVYIFILFLMLYITSCIIML